MLRLLIVDDSSIFRVLLKMALEREPDIRVVGHTDDSTGVVELVLQLEPDLITMDVTTSGVHGFHTMRQIMAHRPTPIVIITDRERETDVFHMLMAGALDVIGKPDNSPQSMRQLAQRIKKLADVRVGRFQPPPIGSMSTAYSSSAAKLPLVEPELAAGAVVIIIASAGGPPALAHILAQLPADLPAATVIVQHIATGFARGLAEWLDGNCALPVRLARTQELLQQGAILVAPDDAHLLITRGRRILIAPDAGTPTTLHPSADVTLRSAAGVCKSDLLAVILTGMGHDGTVGAEAVKATGGRVIVQDQATSVIYSMPMAARPFAHAELPLDRIANYISRFAHERFDKLRSAH